MCADRRFCSQAERGSGFRAMGEPDQVVAKDAARRAREEMHSVTESLRALLEDLRRALPQPDGTT